MRLFCDCKTDEEKSNFFLSGRAVETGVIAPAISNDVAMAYHRCAQLKKEIELLRAKIEEMERQGPVAVVESWANGSYSRNYKLRWLKDAAEGANLYLAPGAQTQPAPSVLDEEATYNDWFRVQQGVAYDGMWTFARAAWMARAKLAAVPEAKP